MVGKKKDATTRYWKAILLKRPETEQFEGAIEELKELSLLMKEEGTPFGKDLKRICRWLIQQSKAFK